VLLKKLKDDIIDKYNKRTAILFVLFMLCLTVLGFRLIYLQVHKYEHYKYLSENNRVRFVKVKAARGFFKDRNDNILVRNTPSYELRILKEDVKDLDTLLSKLNDIVYLDKSDVKKKLRKSYVYEPVKVVGGLSYQQVAYILENSSDFYGVEIDLEPVRSYRDSSAFSHILGYLSEVNDKILKEKSNYDPGDYIGYTGLEKIYEEVLKGKNGARQVEVDSYGRVLEILSEKKTVPGKNVVLTLDARIQEKVHKLMQNKKGAVVVMDIKDFSLLALYSAPTYDLRSFTAFGTSKNRLSIMTDSAKPLLNRAIEGRYPPGSIYKILMATIALNEKIYKESDTHVCNGEMSYGRFKYRCWKKHGHGKINLTEAIMQSCDVYFYNLGLAVGIDKIYKYSTFFGLGSKTGISLPNEKSGFFPGREWKKKVKNEPWFPGETIITSIGQGYMTTTPLQMASMLAGIFNGGNVFTPKLVMSIEDKITGEKEMVESKPKRSMKLPQKVRDTVMKGMVMAVYGKHPTGRRAQVKGIVFGGKTGTAQVVSLKKTEDMEEEDIPEKFRDHAWFSGVFPAVNPRYVVVVMAEHGGSGSRGAAPIAGKIIEEMVKLGYVKAGS